MGKRGDTLDEDRRRQHVSKLQDLPDWRKHRKLPPANATWPTCLIIAPSSVVGNWEREFQTVSGQLFYVADLRKKLNAAQWGYFEVGMYIGTPSARADVLNEFKLGRLDVCA